MSRVKCHALNCIHNGNEKFECRKTNEEMGYCNCSDDIELIDYDSEAFYCNNFSMRFTDKVDESNIVKDYDFGSAMVEDIQAMLKDGYKIVKSTNTGSGYQIEYEAPKPILVEFEVDYSVFDKGDYNTVVGTITKIDTENKTVEFERVCDRKLISMELKRMVELYDILPF